MVDNKKFWLVKFAPFRTSWTEIIQHGKFTLRGVRSPEARKHLKAMRLGNQVLFYQSQVNQAILGLMHVCREAYPDPCSIDPQWVTCDFQPSITFPNPITLETIKLSPELAGISLIRQPRLAVLPLQQMEFDFIMNISATLAESSQAKVTP
jgi:predicted RNA-binding protein with PUA-like domain